MRPHGWGTRIWRRIQRAQTGGDEEGGVGERDKGPEEAEEEPLRGSRFKVRGSRGLNFTADASHAEGKDEGEGKEGGGDGHLPGPADGVLHGGGVERPDPGGPEGDAREKQRAAISQVASAVAAEKAGLDGEEDPRGGGGEDAEDAEDGGQQERIERREPCGGAGVGDIGVGEGVGVAVAGDQRAGDASASQRTGGSSETRMR